MEQKSFQGKFPIYTTRIDNKTLVDMGVDEICQYFTECVKKHPFATYIGSFDHYAHTAGIEHHQIDPDILAAKHTLFCFGAKLTNPEVLAVRPRAIGVCQTTTHFVISFLEAPNPALTQTMIGWVDTLLAQQAKPES